MALIRNCPPCGRSNRIPAKHLSDVGKCGACKAELPPIGEPIEVNEEQFNEIISREQGPGSDRLLGVLVRTMPYGRASTGTNRPRPRRACSRPEGRYGTVPEPRSAVQRSQHSQFRSVFAGSASVPLGGLGGRSHHGKLAHTRSMMQGRYSGFSEPVK